MPYKSWSQIVDPDAPIVNPDDAPLDTTEVEKELQDAWNNASPEVHEKIQQMAAAGAFKDSSTQVEDLIKVIDKNIDSFLGDMDEEKIASAKAQFVEAVYGKKGQAPTHPEECPSCGALWCDLDTCNGFHHTQKDCPEEYSAGNLTYQPSKPESPPPPGALKYVEGFSHATPWDPLSTEPPPGKATYRCMTCTHNWSEQAEYVDKCDCCHHGHCPECGQDPDNECCCEDCGKFPCACANKNPDGTKQKAFREAAPWTKRGIKIDLGAMHKQYVKDGGFEIQWPALVDHEKLDLCRSASDFYLLDALRYGVVNREGCDAQANYLLNLDIDRNAIMREADEAHKVLTLSLDAVFCEYVSMACGGELRHHPAVGGRSIPTHRREAWSCWKGVMDLVGLQALLDMEDLFGDWGTNTGYGGPKWGAAAKLLHDRLTGKMNPTQWVDRVFALVHNGGMFLNKLEWGCQNPRGWGANQLQVSVLPAHAKDNWSLLLRLSSPATIKMWDEYWFATNRARMRANVRPQKNVRSFDKTRSRCGYCGMDPRRGHMLECAAFINGKLADMKPGSRYYQKVEEGLWEEYDWTVWDKPDEYYPVSPDGHITLYPVTRLRVRFYVGNGLNIAQHEVVLSVKDLLNYQIKPTSILQKRYATWPGDAGALKYSWNVVLLNYNANYELGVVHSKGWAEWKNFQKMVLDCGVLLPQGMPDIDWGPAVLDYLADLSAKEVQSESAQ